MPEITNLAHELMIPAVERLAGILIGVVQRLDTNPIDVYMEMIQSNAVVGAALDLRILLGLSILGDYANENEVIQEEVRGSFVNMKGSFRLKIAETMSFMPMGFSFTERAFDFVGNKATIAEMRTLDPRHYRFEGTMGNITQVHYFGVTGDIFVEYDQGMHLINQPYMALGGDPYGVALCRRCLPYWESLKIVQMAMAIAGQRQATPILVGKTDTNAETVLLDALGNPLLDSLGRTILVNQGYSMQTVLQRTGNSSVAVIDRLDEIMAIQQQTDGSFFQQFTHYLETSLLLCFLIPRTVIGNNLGGSGDSNLNEGHRETLGLVVRSQTQQVGESLIEQVVRPMIEYNHGAQKSYGSFPIGSLANENAVEILNAISVAISSGGFSPTDIAVINRMKALAGIS